MSTENKETFELDERDIPTLESLEEELVRERKRRTQSKVLKTIILILLAVIAAVVAVVILVLPIFQITGSAMAHTLNNGDIVVAVKTNMFYGGDIIAYDFNDSTQIMRVIARSGDTVNIDDNGNVYVNGAQLDEPYVEELALGESDIEYPFEVPLDSNFVIGDHRDTSIDSRSTAVGCIKDEDVIGKIIFRIWPITNIGTVK